MDVTANFQDWEVLQNAETGFVHPSDHTSRDLEGIEGDTEGAIRPDYFSLSSDRRYGRTPAEADDPPGGEGEGSDASDNPSWVDPSSEPRYGDSASALDRKKFGGFWSDSNSDLSGSQKSLNFDARIEFGFGDDSSRERRTGDMGEFKVNDVVFREFWSDSGGDPSVWMKSGDGSELSHEGESPYGSDVGENSEEMEMKSLSGEALKSGEGGKRGAVWWKLPLELLRFCVFRASPFWSLSIAAAVVGVVVLGRRLHNLRRKSQSIPLKVTGDDKKVSQFMIRAARLNEAFSIVRRVPMIRPSLPATGVTPWPVLSLI